MSADFKRCGRCKELKPRAEFWRNRAKPDGLQLSCKLCLSEFQRLGPEKRRDPEKRQAQRTLHYAVQRGRLVRPETCEQCDKSESRIEAHHEDYGRPLDVMWLCALCHSALHAAKRDREAVA